MGFNFPNTPAVNDLYPTPAQAGLPQWKWNGSEWVVAPYSPLTFVQRAGDTMTGALNVVTPPTLPAHAASKAYVDAASVAAAPLNAMNYSGMQINGSFEVAQEGTTTTANGGYACDGWRLLKSGTASVTLSVGAAAWVPGLTNLLSMTVQTAQPAMGAADSIFILQVIEGYRIAQLAWGKGADAKPITIAFWSAHQRTGIYTGTICSGTANRSYAFTYTQAASNTTQYNVITIPGCPDGTWDVNNLGGLQLALCAASGTSLIAPSNNMWVTGIYRAGPGQVNAVAATSDVLRFAGLVVLPGIYAPTAAQSPLIMRPYDQELVTCQRYYEHSWADGVAGPPGFSDGVNAGLTWSGGSGYGAGTYLYKVVKRATPTCTYYDGAGNASKVVGFNGTVWVGNVATANNSGDTKRFVMEASAYQMYAAHIRVDARL